MVMARCMTVRRAVAATDVPARQAQAQVNPARTGLQAFLATGRKGGNGLNFIDVIAGHERNLSVVSDAKKLADPVRDGDERARAGFAAAAAASRPLRPRHREQRPDGAAVVILQSVLVAGACQCGREFGRAGTDHGPASVVRHAAEHPAQPACIYVGSPDCARPAHRRICEAWRRATAH